MTAAKAHVAIVDDNTNQLGPLIRGTQNMGEMATAATQNPRRIVIMAAICCLASILLCFTACVTRGGTLTRF